MALTQVTSDGIATGAVTANDISDGSISTAKIADDAVTADKLANTSVTAGSYTVSSITVDAQGRITAASSGTAADTDKIEEGDTNVECVDTGSDGHITFDTEGSERMRIDSSGNLGIGTASPTQKLDVRGSVYVGTSIGINTTSPNGLLTVEANSGRLLTFRNSTTGTGSSDGSYIALSGSDLQISNAESANTIFYTGDTERMRIDSSGRLLRGLTSTSANANTVLQGSSGGTTGAARLFLQRGGAPANGQSMADIFFADNSSNEGARIGAVRDGGTWTSGSSHPTRLVFFTTADSESSPTERMRLDSSGVTTFKTADVRLEATSNTTNTQLSLGRPNSSSAGYIRYRNSENAMAFRTNGSGEDMRIDSSGRLLVGTTSADSNTRLHVSAAENTSDPMATDASIVIANTQNAGNNEAAALKFNLGNTNTASISAHYDTFSAGVNSSLRFYTQYQSSFNNPTERMRISSNGETTLRPASYGLGVRSVAGSSSVNTAYFGAHSSTSINAGTITFEVYTNGNVKNTNNSYGQLSDQRLKENIIDAPSQWDDIKALQIRKYNFREGNGYDTHTQIGLVAQEAETVCPGLVQQTPVREDATPVLDAEGNELEATKSVLTSVLYMKAVKALQEAIARIETLETKVAALEAAE